MSSRSLWIIRRRVKFGGGCWEQKSRGFKLEILLSSHAEGKEPIEKEYLWGTWVA